MKVTTGKYQGKDVQTHNLCASGKAGWKGTDADGVTTSGGKAWGTIGTRNTSTQIQCDTEDLLEDFSAVGYGSWKGEVAWNHSEVNAFGRDANATLTKGLGWTSEDCFFNNSHDGFDLCSDAWGRMGGGFDLCSNDGDRMGGGFDFCSDDG